MWFFCRSATMAFMNASDLGSGPASSSPRLVIFFFPYNPPPPYPDKPPARPTRKSLISVHFGSVWLRFSSVGSVWLHFGSVLGPFRVRFGVLGGVGVGSGRGASVREKNITIPGKPRSWPIDKETRKSVSFSMNCTTIGVVAASVAQRLHHLCRATAVALHWCHNFRLMFSQCRTSIALHPLKCLKKVLSHPFWGGGVAP